MDGWMERPAKLTPSSTGFREVVYRPSRDHPFDGSECRWLSPSLDTNGCLLCLWRPVWAPNGPPPFRFDGTGVGGLGDLTPPVTWGYGTGALGIYNMAHQGMYEWVDRLPPPSQYMVQNCSSPLTCYYHVLIYLNLLNHPLIFYIFSYICICLFWCKLLYDYLNLWDLVIMS